jgi:hypothetical protein
MVRGSRGHDALLVMYGRAGRTAVPCASSASQKISQCRRLGTRPNWRNIAIALIDLIVSEMACLRQLATLKSD